MVDKISKNDVELQKESGKTQRFERAIDLLKIIVYGFIIVLSLREIFAGLSMFIGEEEDGLVIALVRELKLGTLVGYIGWGITALLYVKERKGKQRAIERKGHYQHIAEAGDEERSSSGLTPRGTTPKSN